MFEKTNQPIEGHKIDYPKSTLHSLFEESALLFPASEAIKHGDKQLTYGNLRLNVNQMAHHLLSEGVCPGSVVAVSLDRSPDLIITLFAILQCGAAYVPLDSKFPKARIEFMLENSNCSYLITSKQLLSSFATSINTLLIETVLDSLGQYPNTPLNTEANNEA